MAALRNKARIVESAPLSPSVRRILLEVEGGPLVFRAGQWLHLHVPTAEGCAKRAYSIASAPNEPQIELAVTRVPDGVVSPRLHELPEGTTLELDGPHGFFTRDEPTLAGGPALFIGTGTGVAPLRSMLAEALRDPTHPPVTLLFGCRNQAEVLWREEFVAWAARDDRFRFEITLSRPEGGWAGRTGYVQHHAAELARTLGEPHVFVCGLNKMVSDVRALFRGELGYDRKRVHSERYD